MSAKDLSMLNIAGAAALRRTDDLRVEIRKALANGVTAGEVRGILGQVALHADSSLADCVRAAKQVLADLGN
ncbi:carboxymuconolactone decarboxylase family protein [Mycobacterium sp. 050128]|uniref:carboxymuconolactone decarboxylase family protein n=1 Tax=Mycobacterium sp. 050128 TaxID=3096112 RepID=UPI002ED85B53